MADKNLFATLRGMLLPKTDAVNHANAPAYALAPKQALAQYAATGCFGRTFYATAEEQLSRVLELCNAVEPEFVARVAIYSRTQAYMKDMPALLCAWLSTKDARLHEAVFAKVIDNARMLRNYVQILRSGVVGRKSLGTAPKRLVRQWLAAHEPESLFSSSVGQNPSLADIVKMVHPKPADPAREAFYGYMLGRPYEASALPQLIAQFEQFKAGESLEMPDLPFMMLSALPLSKKDWTVIARNASWQTTRMNLNTFARHGVFEDESAVREIADRLKNEDAIERSRVFPYQLLTAYQNCDAAVPRLVRDALQDAMELAIKNVPAVEGTVVVCPDVSGSMASAVTGHRQGATSAVRCIDVAALVAAAVLRKNPRAAVLPFEHRVVPVELNSRDSVMTNATKLAAIGGGGTSCSAPVALLNQQAAKADLVIFVSDNESWVDAGRGNGTALMAEWAQFRQRNPQARLVCLDIQPYATTQAAERADILNIGGFSDQVFEVISAFAAGQLEADHWVGRIEKVIEKVAA
ncbi:MAG: TROVE domain-containing protein [Acidobacteria bacterium]|nr:TROVE domain-containing protein [Acidobacteriota bacterium]